MAEYQEALKELFAPNGALEQDVLDVLSNTMRIFSLSSEELFHKWVAYVMKMKIEGNELDLRNVQDFKRDLQDQVESETRSKAQMLQSSSKKTNATPRASVAAGGDIFGPRTSASTKRKSNFDTPAPKSAKNTLDGSPSGTPTTTEAANFSDRIDSGKVLDQLNANLSTHTAPAQTPAESRVKLKANTDLSKMAYKGMAMKLSEASEILDDRIDSFTEIIQAHYDLPDTAFGNPAAQSTAEIIAVGRITYDSSVGKLTSPSLVLETSRRMGAGLRVPLKVEGLSYDFFPGKIVALKGTNVSGEYFAVTEILSVPLLGQSASTPAEIEGDNNRLKDESGQTRPLGLLVASGPYTTDSDLSFDGLYSILHKARDEKADVLILNGPFLDLNHPMVASGDFEACLPAGAKIEPDRATIKDVFRCLVSTPIQSLVQSLPSITVILVPSLRDAVSSHISWPQDRFPRPQLGLPKQCQVVTNPITLSINGTLVGIGSEDILNELRQDNVHQAISDNRQKQDLLERLLRNVIEQRHFFPKFPAQAPKSQEDNPQQQGTVGVSLDLGYLKLGEWLNARPDMLILPSVLNPFSRVVENIVCINPGTLSKRRGAGSYARIALHPWELTPEEAKHEAIAHNVFHRARVDVVKI
ncbi:DNA polymerase alpha/primase associated subunit [Polychaeton citri CBS 116435]|uniref:DNA polymerase alpha subunit B n=1 Tax=Polychaeton citri CBS 116435 TaxID=1314669 RepID=A0A9P4UNE5_9PEZI|nr:DNA polymerase alpha/primase associated subunit [Polychaeton citri CBS 116435]